MHKIRKCIQILKNAQLVLLKGLVYRLHDYLRTVRQVSSSAYRLLVIRIVSLKGIANWPSTAFMNLNHIELQDKNPPQMAASAVSFTPVSACKVNKCPYQKGIRIVQDQNILPIERAKLRFQYSNNLVALLLKANSLINCTDDYITCQHSYLANSSRFSPSS